MENSSATVWEKTLWNTSAYPWFDWVASGKKTIECRIYRKDWKKVKVGDIIYFNAVISNRRIKTEITGITIFKTFSEAYVYHGQKMIPEYILTPDHGDIIYGDIYSSEQDKKDLEKYGVIAVGIQAVRE